MSAQSSEQQGLWPGGVFGFPLGIFLLCSPGVMVSRVGGVFVTGEHRGVRPVVSLTTAQMLAAEGGRTAPWGARVQRGQPEWRGEWDAG